MVYPKGNKQQDSAALVSNLAQKRQKLENSVQTVSEEEEDVWLSDGDEEHFQPHAANEEDHNFGDSGRTEGGEHVDTLALRRQHAKRGYVEGLTENKKKSTQRGFDDGYKVGANIGLDVGKTIGILSCLKDSENEEASMKVDKIWKEMKDELFISKVLNHKYFSEDIELLDGKHKLVEKWAAAAENLLEEFQNNL